MNPCTFTPRWLRALIVSAFLFTAYVTGRHINVRVTTSITTACPQSISCHTLQELTQHSSQYFFSYTTFIFQSGYHKGNYSYNVLIQNTSNITLLGDIHGSSVIQCTGAFGLSFMNVTNLTISNLNFHLCGAPIPEPSMPTVYITKLLQTVNYTTTLYFIQVSNVKISNIEVHNSTGVGMLGVNALVSISKTAFIGNAPNCILVFCDNSTFPTLQSTTVLTIINSFFKLGSLPQTYSEYASGLIMMFTQTTYTVAITMSNITIHRNKGNHGSGNMQFILDICSYQCTSIRLYRVNSTMAVGDGISWVFKEATHCNHSCSKTSTNIQISQSQVSNNSGCGIFIINRQPQKVFFQIESTNLNNNNNDGLYCGNINIHIFNTQFIQNHRTAIDASETNIIFRGNTTVASNTGYWGAVSLLQCIACFYGGSNFISNKGKVSGAIIATGSVLKFKQSVHIFADNEGNCGGAISLKGNSRIEFCKSTHVKFEKNQAQRKGGAIYAEDSNINVKSHASVIFTNNTGYNGGALALIDNSHIMLQTPFQVQFLQNCAKRFGGAIYLNDYNIELFNKGKLPYCFIEVQGDLFDISSSHALEKFSTITVENNTAQAGSALYGGWIDLCSVQADPKYLFALYGTKAFKHLFPKQNGNEDLSVVSSNPTRVCICVNSTPNCNITQYNVTVYPGEIFQIPAVAVGQKFGTVPFTVQSNFVSNYKTIPQMEQFHYAQTVRKECTNLTYSIRSSNTFEMMQLQVDKFEVPEDTSIDHALTFHADLPTSIRTQFINLQVYIKLHSCPLGFAFDENLLMCSCASQLHMNKIACNISTKRVSRPTSFWINATHADNKSSVVIVHPYCPFDYCKSDSFDLDLEYPDEQCAFHRSGILCGQCQQNLSHVFGTSACRKCSSLWALLWIPFIALAGIALVVLLVVLNLTVSVGTINGLIFYANVVRANHTTFFPPKTTNSFLSWFIAWINLDLGIETCFYNGLDAYVKTWLQFVFPLYIWLIVVLIIVLSHYFNKIAKLSGTNAVQVLATLFLLSYAKLLRIIITVFSFTLIKYPDKSVKVWLYDGNVNYLEGKHIPLFVSAVILLLAISGPYTGMLLFIQCFQKLSNHNLLSWIHKLKPLFDAYTGPYKDRHRYWTGLLLLVRAALFIIFSVNAIANPAVNLLTITITTFCLITHGVVFGQVYKAWILNAIEYSYLLNLGVLSCATFYTRVSDQEDSRGATGQDQKAVVYTSVAIALATFTIIVVMYIVKKAKSFPHCNRSFLKRVNSKLSKLRGRAAFNTRRQHHHSPPSTPAITTTSIQLRESLLDY